MSEARLKRSATRELIERFPNCCFCGGMRSATTREHMPPKALFNNSHRPDKLVMPACDQCNRGTSAADLIASVISRWSFQDNPATHIDHAKLAKAVRDNYPELIEEWTEKGGLIDQIRIRTKLQNRGVPIAADAGVAKLGPTSIRYLNLFAHKVTLGLYFEHFEAPLPDTGRVCAYWRTKEDVAQDALPPRDDASLWNASAGKME